MLYHTLIFSVLLLNFEHYTITNYSLVEVALLETDRESN